MTNDIRTTLDTTVDSVKIYTQLDSTLIRKTHVSYKTLQADLVLKTGNMIPNRNITRDDIMCTQDIFGPNLGSLKEKNNKMADNMDQHTSRNN